MSFPSSKQLGLSNYRSIKVDQFYRGRVSRWDDGTEWLWHFVLWDAKMGTNNKCSKEAFEFLGLDLKIYCELRAFNFHLISTAAVSLGVAAPSFLKARFQSLIYRGSFQDGKIQEILHRRNWCLCRWNSSIVTISLKWQQCYPDHCLRDDILLNSISSLIISSCSIHHVPLFSPQCIPCSSPLLSSKNIFLTSLFFHSPLHMWSLVIAWAPL